MMSNSVFEYIIKKKENCSQIAKVCIESQISKYLFEYSIRRRIGKSTSVV